MPKCGNANEKHRLVSLFLSLSLSVRVYKYMYIGSCSCARAHTLFLSLVLSPPSFLALFLSLNLSLVCARMRTLSHNSWNPFFVRLFMHTGWRRLIGFPELQIIFHKRATRYRSLLRKMTYKDKGSYESSPPCTDLMRIHLCCMNFGDHACAYVCSYVCTPKCIYLRMHVRTHICT